MSNPPNNLKAARTAQKFTLESLAHAAGLSFTTVWAVEVGKVRPSLSTAHSLARILGTTVDELFPEAQEASA